MIPRVFVGIFLSLFALANAAFCGADPARPAPAEATSVVAYVLQNHNEHVTVQDGAGKTLRTALAGTPTLQLVISVIPAVRPDPRQVSLLLRDLNGLRLWSQLLPMAPQMHTFTLSAKSGSATKGTRLELLFSAKGQGAATAPDEPELSPFIMTIDAKGQFVGIKGGDKGVNLTTGHDGVVFTGPNGGGESASVNLDKGGNGGMMVINGVQIPIKRINRSGKSYLSFPWNGHQVFVGDGCTISVTSDGELTVDPPSAGKR